MSTPLGEVLDGRRAAEFQKAARALLKEPLLLAHGPYADELRLVRRHAAELREWFDRNTGWPLRVDAESARLGRTPGTLSDPTHPAREAARARAPFTRRRYVLLCLALAALERGEAQIALGRLAEQVVLDAADPQLAAAGIEFTLERRDERLDLAAVVRLLMRYGVLRRVAGDEDAYVSGAGDVLYDVQRRVLAGLLAARRGPSLITAEDFEDRLAELTAESALDSDELRFRAIRQTLTRRLLDDPVLYYDELTDEELAYLTRQRAFITARITELTGLVAEVRAEGIAMVDPQDDLTDVRMPEQGTHGHVTLLLAEHLASAAGPVSRTDLERRVRELAAEHGGFWSKSAKQPGAEGELAEQALAKLTALGLITRTPAGDVAPLPALARYAVGETVVRQAGAPARPGAGTPARQAAATPARPEASAPVRQGTRAPGRQAAAAHGEQASTPAQQAAGTSAEQASTPGRQAADAPVEQANTSVRRAAATHGEQAHPPARQAAATTAQQAAGTPVDQANTPVQQASPHPEQPPPPQPTSPAERKAQQS